MFSAFGVDHGSEIAKAKDEPPASAGRRATATYYGSYHSVAAGKKGKRLRAAGRSELYGTGGALAGAGTGAGLAALATRGRGTGAMIGAGAAGSVVGNMVGNNRAFHANNRRGYYKPEG